MKNLHSRKRIASVARAAARSFGATADTAGKVALAALFGNPAEEALALSVHDPLHDLERMRDEADAATTPKSHGGSILDAEIAKLFRVAGTAVWKLEQRMLDAETKEPRNEYRRLWRHVEAIKDALTDIGVDIVDWTNKRYDEGMSLKVVSEEERLGTKEPEIVETLLPTIRFRKQIQLQQGEVVVSRPAATAPPSNDDCASGANDNRASRE